MNTPPLSPATGTTRRQIAAGLCLLLCLAGLAGCAELIVSRAVPWGQHVELTVWTSLVVPLPLEEAMIRTAVASTTELPLAERIAGWLGLLARWACQVEVTVRTDQAAVIVEDRRQLVTRLPQPVLLHGDATSLTIESLGDAGAVQVRVGRGETLAIAAGMTADIALAPAPSGDGWVSLGGEWRAIVEDRLIAGLPVGRLTIINLGLRPAGQGR